MKNYYEILGLPFGASLAEIRTAYRKLALQYHPDKNVNNQFAADKFIEINEAYTVLSNKDKSYFYHLEYTEYLQQPTQQPTSTVFDYHKNPTQYPRTAKGQASSRELDKKGILLAVALLVVVFVLAYFMRIKQPDRIILPDTYIYKNSIEYKVFHLTREDYYTILSQDYEVTHDSTLLKIQNVDSVIHILTMWSKME